MNGVLIFVFTTAIAMACMALALSIASNILHKTTWGWQYVVIQSCLVGLMVVHLASNLCSVFMPSGVYKVFGFIFDVTTTASMSFVIVFLPYFLSWVIAKPWRKRQTLKFYPLAGVYFGLGLSARIVSNRTFDLVAEALQTMVALGVFIYCIVILWMNLRNIQDPPTRHIALAINIVSVTLIPLAIISIFFEFVLDIQFVKDISYPIYVFAISLVIVIYNYIRFEVDQSKASNKPKLNFESLSHYKISEREFEVIQLICNGLTNKEIANELNISVNTVNNHVTNIFSKMDVRSRIDLLCVLKEGPWS